MRTIFLALAAVTLATQAPAGQRVDTAAWGNVQSYDVPALLQQEASLIGKVVAVRFQYRSQKLRHLQPSWFEASIWQHDPKAKNGFSAVRVMVAKKDVPAFESITSDFNSTADLTVYGRIETDPDNNQIHLRFLGVK